MVLLLSIKAGFIASFVTIIVLFGLSFINNSGLLNKINIHPRIKIMINELTKNNKNFINITALSFIVTIFTVLLSKPKCKSIVTI